jgi:hypothetical protein
VLLLENVTDNQTNDQVMMTHEVTGAGDRAEHMVRFYEPRPASGPLAGRLIGAYVLSAGQAAELKAHL